MPSPLLIITSQANSAVTKTQTPSIDPTAFAFATPYDADTLNVSLASTSGVSQWSLALIGTDGSLLTSAITVTNASLVSGVATIALPSGLDDFAFILQSQVNGGTNPTLVNPQNPNGMDSTFTQTTKISVKVSNRNSVSFAESQENDIRNGYNSLIFTRDVGRIQNASLDAGLISEASFGTPYSGNPLTFSSSVVLADTVDQTKAFAYTTIATGTYKSPVPSLKTTRDAPRNSTVTNSLYFRGHNQAGPVSTAYTTSIPMSVYCRFKLLSNPASNLHWVWYKSGNSEGAPTTQKGIGIALDSTAGINLSLVCNATSYPLGIAQDFDEHSLLVAIQSLFTAVIYLDKNPPITITGLTINTLDRPFYLGDITSIVDTAFAIEFKDFRVWNGAKTQAHAWALANEVV